MSLHGKHSEIKQIILSEVEKERMNTTVMDRALLCRGKCLPCLVGTVSKNKNFHEFFLKI